MVLVKGVSFQACHSKDTGFYDRPDSLSQDATEKAQKTTQKKITLIYNYHHGRQDLGAVAEAPKS